MCRHDTGQLILLLGEASINYTFFLNICITLTVMFTKIHFTAYISQSFMHVNIPCIISFCYKYYCIGSLSLLTGNNSHMFVYTHERLMQMVPQTSMYSVTYSLDIVSTAQKYHHSSQSFLLIVVSSNLH